MKTRAILFSLFAGTVLTQAQGTSPAQQAQALYARGLAAERAGDPATAKAAYTAAIKTDPGHADARFRLGELKTSSGKVAEKGREAKFGNEVIPVFALEAATLQEALDALAIAIGKASGKGEEGMPNFVIEDATGKLAQAKISIQLKGVPGKGILSYITNQTASKVRFDEHAVVIVAR